MPVLEQVDWIPWFLSRLWLLIIMYCLHLNYIKNYVLLFSLYRRVLHYPNSLKFRIFSIFFYFPLRIFLLATVWTKNKNSLNMWNCVRDDRKCWPHCSQHKIYNQWGHTSTYLLLRGRYIKICIFFGTPEQVKLEKLQLAAYLIYF